MSKLRPDTRKVVKVSYKAVNLIASVVGGLVVGVIFNRAWSAIERGDDVPRATDEQRGWREILFAAGLHGTIFALVKAGMDRGAAAGTRKLTGTWPGDEGRQPGKLA